MISSSEPESRPVHHLAKFVTKEAIAMLLKLQPEQIYRINCWRYVIHVVGLTNSRSFDNKCLQLFTYDSRLQNRVKAQQNPTSFVIKTRWDS